MAEVEKRVHQNPWWIPRLLFGFAPEVERRKLTLLGCVAIAMVYENYDLSVLNTSLKHIAESLLVDETNLGYFVASIRFAGLFGLLFIPAADLIGRRRLFLISIIGMSLGTTLTGFSQSPEQFVVLQMATRGFMITACAMAVVILVEEFPAEHRGWAIGMLGAASVVGHGVGTILFACIDVLPFGWRTLYLLGFIPIIRLPMFRRGIYEPGRFQRYKRDDLGDRSLGYSFTSWLLPYGNLVRRYPLGFVLMAGVVTLAYGGFAVVFSFLGYFVLSYRGLEPWQFATLLILSGSLSIPGASFSGRMCDLYGRRPVGCFSLITFAVCSWVFFRGPDWAMYAVAVPMMYSAISGNVVIMAFSSELFPTSLRGTSAGLVMLLGATGAGIALLLVGALTGAPGDITVYVPILALSTVLSASLMLFLPETKTRELEEISWEKKTQKVTRDSGPRVDEALAAGDAQIEI